MIPSAWGPKVGATLSDGTVVFVHARLVGNESEKQFVVRDHNGSDRSFWIDRIHGGCHDISIFQDVLSKDIWIIAGNDIIGYYDMTSKTFFSESEYKAVIQKSRESGGELIASGSILSFWQLFSFETTSSISSL
jgi:hypothetical protein